MHRTRNRDPTFRIHRQIDAVRGQTSPEPSRHSCAYNRASVCLANQHNTRRHPLHRLTDQLRRQRINTTNTIRSGLRMLQQNHIPTSRPSSASESNDPSTAKHNETSPPIRPAAFTNCRTVGCSPRSTTSPTIRTPPLISASPPAISKPATDPNPPHLHPR